MIAYDTRPAFIMNLYITKILIIYLYILKIIPAWPRVNLPRFHQTALQGRFGILALSHVLSTIRFSLANSAGVFSFD